VETNRKLRLKEKICEYNITPIYIEGKDNQLADFLSRQIENNNIEQINNIELVSSNNNGRTRRKEKKITT